MPIIYPHTIDDHSLEKPALPDKLWRYMDFTKFIAMLVNRGLFMSRLDRLGDAYEGWIPETPRAKYRGFFQEKFFKRDRQLRKRAAILRKRVYVNCWHANDNESDAMWKLYLTGEDGIAIYTTCRSLRSALEQSSEELWLYRVIYADQTKEPIHGGSMLRACLTKRPPFAHEKEVRLVWWNNRATGQRTKAGGSLEGFYVKCDLEKLMERVHIAPTCNPWFGPIVKDVIEKYGIKAQVLPSVLNLPPP